MQVDSYGAPVHLEAGVRCGAHWRGKPYVYHESAAAVRLCYAMRAEMEAQQAAEIAAEQAYERHLEDAGWQEALAQREHEDRMGVIQFDEAYRMACPELFQD